MEDKACNLESCFLCRNCIPDWKSLIALKKRTISFKKGREILREGEVVKGIFFMYTGSAKVSKNWGGKKELILRFATQGDVLGHRGFGGDLVYPVSATAIEDCEVCFIDNELLETFLKTNPPLTYQLMKVYAAELQKAEKRMRDLVHMDVKGRIALALFEIAEVFGTGKDDYILVPITRQDIASYAGTTYETIFKFFIELLDQQAIATSGKNIKINDHRRLRAFITGQS
jgi:CRP/FNR family transcriptional regulator